MSRLHKNTNGGARLLLFLLVALVLGGIGFAAWRLLREEKKPQTKEEKSLISCISDDKIICKYITSWEPSTSYRFTVDETSGGVQTVTTYDYDLGDTDKIHTKVEGDAPYEIITIGNTVYTKAGDTWWKETIDQGNDDKRSSKKDDKSSQDFEPVKPTQYTKVGKEACGKLQCYKYEVDDPGNPDTEQFIWFDDEEYKLRKLTFETADTISEQTFEYIEVKINKPSPVKDLASDECIIPGQSEPAAKPCS